MRVIPFLDRIPEAAALSALVAVCGCSTHEERADPFPYDRLSEFGLFDGELAELSPVPGVLPYEVRSQLWADQAIKLRFLQLPPDTFVSPTDNEDWDFPEGAVVVKTFGFLHDQRDPGAGRRLLETRLLIREAAGWSAHVYLWNDAQTEAVRRAGGGRLTVSYTDAAGMGREHAYVIPNTNMCESCHARNDATQLLGVISPQLDFAVERDGASVNQLTWLSSQDLFAGEPEATGVPAFVDPFGDADLDARARSWLHANCSHCHRPGGNGGVSGLVLLAWEDDPGRYGVCKRTAAAGGGTGGKTYDIVPGMPSESIMPFRIGSTEPDVKMPELPNLQPDQAGLALVEAWIAALEFPPCE